MALVSLGMRITALCEVSPQVISTRVMSTSIAGAAELINLLLAVGPSPTMTAQITATDNPATIIEIVMS